MIATAAIYLLCYDEPSGRHEVVKVKDGSVLWTYTLPWAANDSQMTFGLATDHTPDLANISVGPQGVVAVVDTSVRKDGESHMSWEVHVIDRDTGQQLHSYTHTDTAGLHTYRGPCEIDVERTNGNVFVLSGGVLYKLSSTLSLLQQVGPFLDDGSPGNAIFTNGHAFIYNGVERYSFSHNMRLDSQGEVVVVGATGGNFSQWGIARSFVPDLYDPVNYIKSLSPRDYVRFWPADGSTDRGGAASLAAFGAGLIRGYSSTTEFRPLTYEHAGAGTPRNSAIRYQVSWTAADPPTFLPRLHTMGTRCYVLNEPVMLNFERPSGQIGRASIAVATTALVPAPAWEDRINFEFFPEDATPKLSAADDAIPSGFLSDPYGNLYIHGRRSDQERFIACVQPAASPTHIWSVLASESSMQGKLANAIHWILDAPGMGNSSFGSWLTT
ncbi:MAG: hypothetical protein AAF797_06985 [Planctomycetota bacterium]